MHLTLQWKRKKYCHNRAKTVLSATPTTNFHKLIIVIIFWIIFSFNKNYLLAMLTHWGRVMHICVVELTVIGSDDGLSPGRRQAIIWTDVGISLTGPLGTNFIVILIRIQTFSFKKALEDIVCEMASILSRPQCVDKKSLVLPLTCACWTWTAAVALITDTSSDKAWFQAWAPPIPSSEKSLRMCMPVRGMLRMYSCTRWPSVPELFTRCWQIKHRYYNLDAWHPSHYECMT